MKVRIVFSLLLIILSFTLLKPDLIFAKEIKIEDVTESEGVTVNEYELLKDLSKESSAELSVQGYSQKEIKQIKNYEENYSKHLKQYIDLPDKKLKGLGYTEMVIVHSL